MKLFKSIVAAVIVAAGVCAAPASAQFRIGPKVGINVSKLHLNSSTFDSENRAGFNAGLMTEFTVPVLGIGFDASVMYVRRNDRFMGEYEGEKGTLNTHRDYIDIPINFKWKIGVPVISSIVKPFLTTGPSFAFLTSKRSFEEFKNKKCDVAWNFGLGVELLKHVQVAASYGIGINKSVEAISNNQTSDIAGKNRYWTVTAAYLF